MPKYMKGYLLSQLRVFPLWKERLLPHIGDGTVATPLNNEDIVYLCEDFKVLRDCFDNESLLFEENTEDWRRFCIEQLGFHVPDWKGEA